MMSTWCQSSSQFLFHFIQSVGMFLVCWTSFYFKIFKKTKKKNRHYVALYGNKRHWLTEEVHWYCSDITSSKNDGILVSQHSGRNKQENTVRSFFFVLSLHIVSNITLFVFLSICPPYNLGYNILLKCPPTHIPLPSWRTLFHLMTFVIINNVTA